jgi:pimeloyl-ACP methyl ester carboxylesterase
VIGQVSANGVRFSYIEEGTGPLALLLHGFPDTAHTWDFVRPAVAAAGYRAVSPFMRGYAPSEVPADGRYDQETLGRDVLALIEALGERQATVIGHDWGATASYGAALLGPEKVRLLVTVAIPFPASIIPTPRLLGAMRHFITLRRSNAAEVARANDFALIDELVQRWSPRWKVPAGETMHVKECFRQPGSLDAALGYYRALSPFLPKWAKQQVQVPSVAFAGEHDNVPVKAYERARRYFPKGYDVVAMPGGHFMHREYPEHFTRELLARLKR